MKINLGAAYGAKIYFHTAILYKIIIVLSCVGVYGDGLDAK